MQSRQFGRAPLSVSVVGFGAWAIGGPAMAGTTPIGWGAVDDATSLAALREADRRGITFFDTADFYGLGHSEELIGRLFAGRTDLTIATKVGHLLRPDGSITLDYSRDHILRACEASLRRLQRERIELYQLHSARLEHLRQGECIEAMELLRQQGKIGAWGLSLNTYRPAPEAEFLMEHRLGDAFQLVLNVINQRAVPLLARMQALGYGVIVRMPLQFGLLTGKFSPATRFTGDDHRAFRLPPPLLADVLEALEAYWPLARQRGISHAAYSLSFCASFPEVSTVIAGIRTPGQAEENSMPLVTLSPAEREALATLYRERYAHIVEMMEARG